MPDVAEEQAPPDPDGLALVGDSMEREAPSSRRRFRWTLVLLVAALVVPGVLCVGVATSFSTVVHRDPPPDLESAAVVDAQADAIRRTGAALDAGAPAGATPVSTARSDACFRGSRQLRVWDDFDWVCATRSTAVLGVALADLRAALYGGRDRLAAAGWTVATDRLEGLAGQPDAAAAPQPRASDVLVLDRDRTRLVFSYGPADPGYVDDGVARQRVRIGAGTDPHWEIASPALDRTLLLAAVRPQGAFVVLTAQHVWFAN